MIPFREQLVERSRPAYHLMLAHPFVAAVADGTIDDARFAAWLRQDHLFVREAVPFLALLLARAPAPHHPGLIGALAAFQAELGLFERMAQAAGVALEPVEMAPTCHAYVQFLHATAYRRTYAEAFAVLYGTERTYHDCWRRVRETGRAPARWEPFVENWAGEPFRRFVDWLGAEVDALATAATSAEREAMADLFLTTVRYEIRFWDMAMSGERWPG